MMSNAILKTIRIHMANPRLSKADMINSNKVTREIQTEFDKEVCVFQ